MHTIAAKALIIFLAAAAVGGGVALFTIAKQDDSKAGQFLGVAIPVCVIIAAIYFMP
jgi:FtsH-binding integral membrane protein